MTSGGEALMEKTIRRYGNVYRKALLFRHCREIEAKTATYEARLREMYASDGFKAHSVYPTTNATHVYAVIAMCLEIKVHIKRWGEKIHKKNKNHKRAQKKHV